MKLAITLVREAAPRAPFVLRGAYAETIRHAAEIGYDAVELHSPDPAEVDVGEVEAACDATGLSVSSIGTGLAFTRDGLCLTSPDAAVRQAARSRMRAFVRLGGALNAVVIVGLIKGQARNCGDFSAYRRFLSEALDDCLAVARQCGATVVLEAVNRYESDVLNTIGECVEFIERFDTDHLKLHIDTFHMNMEEDHIGANIVAAGRHIGHVHVADSNRAYPGCGHYDFSETIAALREIDYRGALSVECLALPTPKEAARGAYRFLRRAMAASASNMA